MTYDIFRAEAHLPAYLLGYCKSLLVCGIDMHAKELSDLAIVPFLQIILGKNQALSRSEVLKDVGACFSFEPCGVRKPLLVFILRLFNFGVVIQRHLFALFILCSIIVHVSGVVLELLDNAEDFVAEAVVDIAAEATVYILVTLGQDKEAYLHIIHDLFFTLMAIAFDDEVEPLGYLVAVDTRGIFAAAGKNQWILRHEESYKLLLLSIMEVYLPAL